MKANIETHTHTPDRQTGGYYHYSFCKALPFNNSKKIHEQGKFTRRASLLRDLIIVSLKCAKDSVNISLANNLQIAS